MASPQEARSFWMCCCQCRTTVREGTPLMVANCGHMYCVSCKPRSRQEAHCDTCGHSVTFLLVDDNIQKHSKVGHYFQDVVKTTERALSVLKFQQYHKLKDWLYQNGMEAARATAQAELEWEYGELAKESIGGLQLRLVNATSELRKAERMSSELDTKIAMLEESISQYSR